MENKRHVARKVVRGYCIGFIIFVGALNWAGYELFYAKAKRAKVAQQKLEDLQNISDGWLSMCEYSKRLDAHLDTIKENENLLLEYSTRKDSNLYQKDIENVRKFLCEMRQYYNEAAGGYNAWMFPAYDEFPHLDQLLDVARANPLPRKYDLVSGCTN